MKNLQEIEYEEFFKPKTMASLKKKSADSLKKMFGDKNLSQALSRSGELLGQIIEAERDNRELLAEIAKEIVTQAYPVIKYNNIKIEAEIVDMGAIHIKQKSNEEPVTPDFGKNDPDKLAAKRRIQNGITQGAAVRGAFWFELFRDYLDDLGENLVSKYNEILKLVFGIYDDENAIAMLLAMIARNQNRPGGESQMDYDDNKEQFIIKAKAICFPMLVHEIIKGLYEIVGTEGFSSDKTKNQAIIGMVDKLENEPRDFQYGKFIFDKLNDLYIESKIDDRRVRELFFAEVYKLSENEFIEFIENLLNDELTSSQKNWAMKEMKDIESDLKKDDTGLTGLSEEFKRMVKLAGIK